MATTTNYGWTTPDDTALVKDGAAAIRTLGSSVDTTTKALNPSTTLGDVEYRSSTANTNTRLGIGSSGQSLTVVAGVPSWAASATSVLTTTGDTLYASAANTLARLGIGSNGTVLTVAAGVPSWATPGGQTYAVFRDEKSSGTDGGTFTTGAWRTRDLNTSQFNNITSASLASNQITLPAGTYLIEATAPAYKVNQHQARLQNITDSTTQILGATMFAQTTYLVLNTSRVSGLFTIAASKVFELQHRSDGTTSGNGFGVSAGWGTEVYSSITITKVA